MLYHHIEFYCGMDKVCSLILAIIVNILFCTRNKIFCLGYNAFPHKHLNAITKFSCTGQFMLKFLWGEDIGFMMKILSPPVCVCVCVKKVSNRNNFRRTIVTQEGINIINIAQKLMTWKFRSLVRLNLSGWCCVRWGCNKCRRMLYIMGIFPFISVLHSKPNFKS